MLQNLFVGEIGGPPVGPEYEAIQPLVQLSQDQQQALILGALVGLGQRLTSLELVQQLPTGGRVLVCEMVVTDEPGPTPAKMLDIQMLVMTVGGKERTRDEFSELFASSGLRLSRIVPTERPICVIEVGSA